jgi:hypothetical protein
MINVLRILMDIVNMKNSIENIISHCKYDKCIENINGHCKYEEFNCKY